VPANGQSKSCSNINLGLFSYLGRKNHQLTLIWLKDTSAEARPYNPAAPYTGEY